MVQQQELCLASPPRKLYSRLEIAFFKFDQANPHVKERFDQHCADLLAAGFTHYSPDAICHAIRFAHDLAIQDVGDRDVDGKRLRLNNNLVAYYAARWTKEHPERPHFFQSRKQHAGRGCFDDKGNVIGKKDGVATL